MKLVQSAALSCRDWFAHAILTHAALTQPAANYPLDPAAALHTDFLHPDAACLTLTHWTLLQLGQAVLSHVQHSHQGTHWLYRLPHSHNVIWLHSGEDMVAGIIISLQHQVARECEAPKASQQRLSAVYRSQASMYSCSSRRQKDGQLSHIRFCMRPRQRQKGAACGRVSQAGNDKLADLRSQEPCCRMSGRRVPLLAGHDAARGGADTAHPQGSGLVSLNRIIESAAGVRQDLSWTTGRAALRSLMQGAHLVQSYALDDFLLQGCLCLHHANQLPELPNCSTQSWTEACYCAGVQALMEHAAYALHFPQAGASMLVIE